MTTNTTKKTARVSIDPKKWGGSAWKFIGHVVDSYGDKPTTNDKNDMKKFVLALQDNIPCKTCRDSLKKYARKKPVTGHLSNQKALKGWFDDYKSSLSQKKGKGAKKPTSKKRVTFKDA